MALIDIYNNAQNPIDNIEILNKLIELYSKPNGDLYSELIRANENTDSRQKMIKDADEFYSMIFNKWKKSITSLTKEQFIELYKKGTYGNELITLRKELLKTPDLKTEKEVRHFIYSEKDNEELENAINRYSWSSFGYGSGWEHICSRYVDAKRSKADKIEHRLYIRVDSLGIYKIGKLFVEKCSAKNIPYYFKFALGENRDDSLVVYSSTEHLNEYIEILEEIKKENQELNEYIGKPPILTIPVKDWIGYGSEPAVTKENGKSYSFNELRADIIEESIVQATSNWIDKHKDLEIDFRGKKVKFDNYILMVATNKFVESLNDRYDREKNIQQKYAPEKTEKDIIEKLGYSKNDLENPKFKENIYRVIMSKKDIYMKAIIEGNYKELDELTMIVRNGKQVKFYNKYLHNAVKEITPKIAKFDKEYLKDVQSRIKNQSTKYGIDPDNFSFDTTRVREMRIYDDYVISKEIEKSNKKQELKEMFKEEIQKPRERLVNETDEEYERYLREFYNGGNPKS